MIGASCCCHVTLLILLLVLRLAFANINTPLVSSSSSVTPPTSLSPSSSLSSLSYSVSDSLSVGASSSPSAPILSTVTSTNLRISSTTLGSQSTEATNTPSENQSKTLEVNIDQSEHDSLPKAPPISSDNQSNLFKINNFQSEHESLPHDLKTDNPPTSAVMQTLVSSTTSAHTQQSTQTNSMTNSKITQFKLTATSKEKKTLQAVEKIFLKNMGLDKRPRISADYAVPGYMLDLYHSQKEDNSGPSTYLKLKGNGAISANTVRSFVHTDIESSTCQPPRCSWVQFDINTIPEHETIAGAELRIYVDTLTESLTAGSGRTSSEASQAAVEPVQRGSFKDGTIFRIEVHEIMQPRSADGSSISRVLDTRVVPRGNSTWHSFDIRPAVLRWKRSGKNNHGLEIRLVTKTPTLSIDNHVRLRRSIHLPEKEWALQRPLLVTYTNDGPSSSSRPTTSSPPQSRKLTRLKRQKRQTSDEDSKNKRRNRRKNKTKKRKRKKKGNKNICQRHALYVNFKDVGWDDWIVAPTGYSAYYCHGDCMAPLPHFTKASHHAMLQARVYKVDPSAVPMVCCIPTTMQAVIMLYSDEKGRTILKSYQDMIVAECGCK